jgi:hypothetical protein
MDLKEKYILQVNLVTTIKNYNLAYGPHKEGTFIALLLILALKFAPLHHTRRFKNLHHTAQR